MAHEFLKPQIMVDTAVGLAAKRAQLVHTVWRDLETHYDGEVGPEGDEVQVRLPTVIGNAKDLAWRRKDRQIETETIKRRKFTVKLDTYPYQAVDLLREEQTLDIADYGREVLSPMANDVVMRIEHKIVSTIQNAPYDTEVTIEYQERALYNAVVLANEALDDYGVGEDQRWLVIGTGLHTQVKLDPAMIDVHRSGTDALLRRGEIGTLDGHRVMVSRNIGKYEAFLYHPTAFPTLLKAPAPARSVPYSASTSHDGLALSYWESLNPQNDSDRAFLGTFMGTQHLLDPEGPGGANIFVRGVKIIGDENMGELDETEDGE